jgi:sulfide:quinone oxidoreductase
MSYEHHEVLIIGAGSAGIAVAARLLRARNASRVTLVDPSEKHYYQPLWTLVGGGVVDREETVRDQARVIPPGARWIREAATAIDPDRKTVTLTGGQVLGWDYLVVAPGIQFDWDRVKGLSAALGTGGVCTNYAYDEAPYTWEALQAAARKPGRVRLLSAQPAGPFKCGGAPQKILYLAADYMRRQGRLAESDLHFFTPGTTLFGVPEFLATIEKVVERYGIQPHFQHELIEVRGEAREAVFRVVAPDGSISERVEPYDFLHVTPPQAPPEVVRQSAIANAEGWVEADPATLQHPRYPHVFTLGDASGSPNAKTGAAVRKQAPVVVQNLLAHRRGDATLPATYNGYASCPLVTSYNGLILAEFDYENRPDPSFPFDTTKERRSMYWMKRWLLPFLYWQGMLKGRA